MLLTAFTFKIVQVLKHVYENIGKVKSLSSPTPLAPAVKVEKKLAAEFLWNEPSYNLHIKIEFAVAIIVKLKPFSHFIYYK